LSLRAGTVGVLLCLVAAGCGDDSPVTTSDAPREDVRLDDGQDVASAETSDADTTTDVARDGLASPDRDGVEPDADLPTDDADAAHDRDSEAEVEPDAEADADLVDVGLGLWEDVPLSPGEAWSPGTVADRVDGASLPSLGDALPFTRTSGPGTRDVLPSPDGRFEVATERAWGGSVVFFGFAGQENTNTIDDNDTGRELQVALYDPDRIRQGCSHDTSCSTGGLLCPASIRYLGWNPVQGGNRCNEGSPVDPGDITHEPGHLTIRVRPKHWNPDWAADNCEADSCGGSTPTSEVVYTQRLRWVGDHIVEVDMTVENPTDLSHRLTQQELPTLYSSFGDDGDPNLRRLYNSNGDLIAIDQPANDGFFMKNFDSPGGWATLQNDTAEYGVGLYHEHPQTRFQGWQRDGTFNNFRARFDFGIPAFGVIRARAYLMLGSLATQQGLAGWLDANLGPFGVLEHVHVGGEVRVIGWGLDDAAVDRVELLIDGGVVGVLTDRQARPDVCATWVGFTCDVAGFSARFPRPALGAGEHVLDLLLTDDRGNRRIVGRRLFDVDETGRARRLRHSD